MGTLPGVALAKPRLTPGYFRSRLRREEFEETLTGFAGAGHPAIAAGGSTLPHGRVSVLCAAPVGFGIAEWVVTQPFRAGLRTERPVGPRQSRVDC